MTTLLVAFCLMANSSGPERAVLSGVVQTQLGKPIKSADVFIEAAAPKVGIGHLCPGCYPDCGKRVVTDAEGKFVIADLDPTMQFRVLVVAQGFVPAVTEKYFDPKSGSLTVTLDPHDLDRRDPALVVRGRVEDDTGKPILRAIIRPESVSQKQRVTVGDLMGVDKLAITNERGEFRIGISEKDSTLGVAVYGKNVSPLQNVKLIPGKQDNIVRMFRGATVTGRVTNKGEPVRGLIICLEGWDRSRRASTKIETDSKGVFTFVNVPADETFCVFGSMASCRKIGGIRERPFEVGENGSTRNVGTLTVQPAYRLSGRIVMVDNDRIPEGSKMILTRLVASDVQSCVIEEDGSFSFIGLPRGMYETKVRIPGHFLSLDHHRRLESPTMTAAVFVDTDVTDFRIYVERETKERLAEHFGQRPEKERARQAQRLGDDFEGVKFANETSLEDGVRLFNERVQRMGLLRARAPLTDDEIISAIRFTDLEKANVEATVKAALKAICETRSFPAKSYLKFGGGSWAKDYYKDVWEIYVGVESESAKSKDHERSEASKFLVRRVHTGMNHFTDLDFQIRRERGLRQKPPAANGQKISVSSR